MSNITDNDEIELKFAADDISFEDFNAVCKAQPIEGFFKAGGPDNYWVLGDNVIRHRVDNNEITVKRRKSGVSSQDRLEVDVKLAKDMDPEKVSLFLKAAGFELAFCLEKWADIYTISRSGHKFTVVMYRVSKVGGSEIKKFIEIEVDKQAKISVERAKTLLRELKQDLQKNLKGLGEPLNRSLWEIYSGKVYQTIEENKQK